MNSPYCEDREERKMGSSLKMNNSSHSHGQKGNKPYALMLLLAFVAAILGVMVLHKLREKRIFMLLINENNQELLTLRLLFQREKGFNQEARKKLEEMKNKVYTLRTQKLELVRKLSEMESTISSLKDERKIIELTLHEKTNEIKLLTANKNSSTGDLPEIAVLKGLITVKDTEIEGLKKQLNNTRVQSERVKPAKSFTSISTTEDGNNGSRLQLSNDSSSNTKQAEETGQRDIIFERVNENIPNIKTEILSNVKDQRIKLESELLFSNETDEILMGNYQGKAKESHISHEKEQQYFGYNQELDGSNQRYQESQRYTNYRKGDLTTEKPEGSEEKHEMSRKKHSKRKTGVTSQNRRSVDDNSFTRKTENKPTFNTNGEPKKSLIDVDEKADLITNKDAYWKDQIALSDNINETVHSGDGDQSGDKEADMQEKEHERSLWVIESDRNDENNNPISISEANGKHLHEKEATIEQEKTHNTEVKNGYYNEKENELANEEGETEDSEDAETHEPEIDRDDIRRFSESDPDDEVEETEF